MVHVSRVRLLTDIAALRRAHRVQAIQVQVSGDLVLQSVVPPLVIPQQTYALQTP